MVVCSVRDKNANQHLWPLHPAWFQQETEEYVLYTLTSMAAFPARMRFAVMIKLTKRATIQNMMWAGVPNLAYAIWNWNQSTIRNLADNNLTHFKYIFFEIIRFDSSCTSSSTYQCFPPDGWLGWRNYPRQLVIFENWLPYFLPMSDKFVSKIHYVGIKICR